MNTTRLASPRASRPVSQSVSGRGAETSGSVCVCAVSVCCAASECDSASVVRRSLCDDRVTLCDPPPSGLHVDLLEGRRRERPSQLGEQVSQSSTVTS